jgi:putative colanic acid biosynthesis UDP-glucose lipid carrier transferase
MTVNDIPLIAFFKRLLDPPIILGTLIGVTFISGHSLAGHNFLMAVIAFFISSIVYEKIDPYRPWRSGKMWAHARNIFIGWIIIVAILFFITKLSGLSYEYQDGVIIPWLIITPFTLVISHMAARSFTKDRTKNEVARSVIIVGANDVGLKLADRIAGNSFLFMEVHGFFDDREQIRTSLQNPPEILGKMKDVTAYVHEHNIKIIFISQPISAQPRITKLIDELHDTTASIYFLPDIYLFDLMQARFDIVGGIPVVAICETPFTGINSVIKRATDIVVGLGIMAILLPVMLLIALAVKLDSRGPAIFKQRRYGLYGEEIRVYKFRSMTVVDDGLEIAQAQVNDPRITKLGAFLRCTSLDELPQFINVLQGKMSIVGPRPHAVAHNELYRKQIKGYMLRHKVKPGITGWAQVNGLRGETETLDKMKARIELDLEYLRNWSVWFDLWIIIRTVAVVAGRGNAR